MQKIFPVTRVVARAHQAVLDYLECDGSLGKLGGGTFGSVEQAIESLGITPTG